MKKPQLLMTGMSFFKDQRKKSDSREIIIGSRHGRWAEQGTGSKNVPRQGWAVGLGTRGRQTRMLG
jgi:hypothetical protein